MHKTAAQMIAPVCSLNIRPSTPRYATSLLSTQHRGPTTSSIQYMITNVGRITCPSPTRCEIRQYPGLGTVGPRPPLHWGYPSRRAILPPLPDQLGKFA